MAVIIVAALIALLCFIPVIYIVPQQNAYVIERLGKYQTISLAGLHMRIPFVDRIAGKMSLRVSQLDIRLETKTLDNVFETW